jgi:hypothetical protein
LPEDAVLWGERMGDESNKTKAQLVDPPQSIPARVEAGPENQNGVYSNFVQVRLTDYDFVLDFGQIVPPQSDEDLSRLKEAGVVVLPSKARVILPVVVVPALIEALRVTLNEFARSKGIKSTSLNASAVGSLGNVDSAR